MINKPQNAYKCYTLLTILYMMIGLSSAVLLYKLIVIHGIVISAATLIIPFWFMLSDLITEVYGYQASRQLLCCALLGELFFIMIVCAIIRLPSPTYWNHQPAYEIVFSKLPRVFLGSFIAILLGAILNIYCLSRWKIILIGKHFWLRSICASGIGETVFTFLAFIIEFSGALSFSEINKMALTSLIIKIVFLPMAVIPTAIACRIIKRIEGIKDYDVEKDLREFNLSTSL